MPLKNNNLLKQWVSYVKWITPYKYKDDKCDDGKTEELKKQRRRRRKKHKIFSCSTSDVYLPHPSALMNSIRVETTKSQSGDYSINASQEW